MNELLIADAKLAERLDRADGPVEICAPDGRRLGFFTPATPAKYRLEPQIGEEELARREAGIGGRSYTATEVETKMREWRCSK